MKLQIMYFQVWQLQILFSIPVNLDGIPSASLSLSHCICLYVYVYIYYWMSCKLIQDRLTVEMVLYKFFL